MSSTPTDAVVSASSVTTGGISDRACTIVVLPTPNPPAIEDLERDWPFRQRARRPSKSRVPARPGSDDRRRRRRLGLVDRDVAGLGEVADQHPRHPDGHLQSAAPISTSDTGRSAISRISWYSVLHVLGRRRVFGHRHQRLHRQLGSGGARPAAGHREDRHHPPGDPGFVRRPARVLAHRSPSLRSVGPGKSDRARRRCDMSSLASSLTGPPASVVVTQTGSSAWPTRSASIVISYATSPRSQPAVGLHRHRGAEADRRSRTGSPRSSPGSSASTFAGAEQLRRAARQADQPGRGRRELVGERLRRPRRPRPRAEARRPRQTTARPTPGVSRTKSTSSQSSRCRVIASRSIDVLPVTGVTAVEVVPRGRRLAWYRDSAAAAPGRAGVGAGWGAGSAPARRSPGARWACGTRRRKAGTGCWRRRAGVPARPRRRASADRPGRPGRPPEAGGRARRRHGGAVALLRVDLSLPPALPRRTGRRGPRWSPVPGRRQGADREAAAAAEVGDPRSPVSAPCRGASAADTRASISATGEPAASCGRAGDGLPGATALEQRRRAARPTR